MTPPVDAKKRYPGQTKEWYACFDACLREFPVEEIGEEAYEVASRAASTICYQSSSPFVRP